MSQIAYQKSEHIVFARQRNLNSFRSSRHFAKKPILVIIHQDTTNPGHIGRLLKAKGFALDIRQPRTGDILPATLSNHSGAIIFGGPMSVNDNEEYLKREIEWIKVPLEEEKPLIGICLGAQILAVHLGGTVEPDRHGHCEIGYFPVEAAPDEASVFPWPDQVYQWHHEGFTLVSGAKQLAAGVGKFENQAFSYGKSAYGFQFHPEATFSMVNNWTKRWAGKLNLPGAKSRESHFSDHLKFSQDVKFWLDQFLSETFGHIIPEFMMGRDQNSTDPVLLNFDRPYSAAAL